MFENVKKRKCENVLELTLLHFHFFTFSRYCLYGNEWHEGHVASALQSDSDEALVLRTAARALATHDFGMRGHEAA